MQFSVYINQPRALQWGLNPQQAMLFAFLYTCPSWAQATEIDGTIYSFISKGKVIEELPLLTDKPDTVYRLMRQLQDKGVIRLTSQGRRTLVALTELGREWNRRDDAHAAAFSTAEKNPTSEKNPGHPGKKSEVTPEKNPTDQNTNNQITKSAKCKSAPRNALDFSDWPQQPSPEVLADWQTVRKARRSPLTQSAVSLITSQLHEAARHGYGVDYCLKVCCVRGWTGFKFEWLQNYERSEGRPPRSADYFGGDDLAPTTRTRDLSAQAIATDEAW